MRTTLHPIVALSSVLIHTNDCSCTSLWNDGASTAASFVSPRPVPHRPPGSTPDRRRRALPRPARAFTSNNAGLFLDNGGEEDGGRAVGVGTEGGAAETDASVGEGGGGLSADTFFSSFPSLGATNEEDRALRKRDMIRSLLRRLANLSLQDYSWRSDYFKKTEADRRVEESLARMMGEDAAYVRPMDATDDKIGPLGRAEKQLVEWLSLVIEEEGRRARLISSSSGTLVRPMDLPPTDSGPLSRLESTAVSFLDDVRASEQYRAETNTLRPKDLVEEKRGPLGEAEARAVEAVERIAESERMRKEMGERRGGELVRPIDVPGPLGELERWYVELFSAELERARAVVREDGAVWVRPKDSVLQGPMGDAEERVSDALNVIKSEEEERFRSMRKVLRENRPMDKDRDSTLGLVEAFIVGIFKGPQLLLRVVDRVIELMQSSALEDEDLQNGPPSLPSISLNGNDGIDGSDDIDSRV